MTVHELQRASLGTGPHFYFACDHCGWCGPLHSNETWAHCDEADHWDAKQAARRDGLAHAVEAQKLSIPPRSAG